MVNQTINTNQIRVFTATTTSQRLFAANKRRKAYAIYNNGSNIVEVCDSSQAYGYGYPIRPTEELSEDHFNCQGDLFVIATGGNTELRVWEIIGEER